MGKYSAINISSPDELLLAELINNNSKAFDVIFKRYYENLCRLAFTYTKDEDMSQSLVQNVFIKLWLRRKLLSSVNNIIGYLTVMVRNQCIDYLKENNSHNISIQEYTINDIDNSTEEEVLIRNFEEKLIKAISKLPPRCKEAFEYSRFENMTNKEIASELNISIKGVEALIGRSLKILRTELKEFLPSFNISEIDPLLFIMLLSRKFSHKS